MKERWEEECAAFEVIDSPLFRSGIGRLPQCSNANYACLTAPVGSFCGIFDQLVNFLGETMLNLPELCNEPSEFPIRGLTKSSPHGGSNSCQMLSRAIMRTSGDAFATAMQIDVEVNCRPRGTP